MPLPIKLVPVPKLTWPLAPPRLTTRGEELAAKPPLALVAHCTWFAAVPMARVKVPAISITASVPAVVWLKRRLLLADRLLIEPNVSAALAATVAFALRRMCVGSRMATMVVPPATPVPVTVCPMTRPYELPTQRSVVAVAAAVTVALVAAEFASCARRIPLLMVVAPEYVLFVPPKTQRPTPSLVSATFEPANWGLKVLSPVEVPCRTTVAARDPMMAIDDVLLKISVALLAAPAVSTLLP